MAQKDVIKLCKTLGCCEVCCIRYVGVKNPNVYAKPHEFILKYSEPEDASKTTENLNETSEIKMETEIDKTEGPNDSEIHENGITVKVESNGTPPAKRKKMEICSSCLGILQDVTWPQAMGMVKEQLDKKKYEIGSFACALSSPIAILLREKAITLHLKASLPDYDPNCLTALKEAWKWTFASKLEGHIGKTLESGSSCPLLVTVVMEYPDDLQELETIKQLSPSLFKDRRQQRRRFTVEMTRRVVEQVLDGVTLEALNKLDWKAPVVYTSAHCASVVCSHTPDYLGGRYIKLSRELPQTPWVCSGERMMESSVQETIFEPLAALLHMSPEEAECRMKFMSAGREDVDVRCLGEGRPFAIELADPRRRLTSQELQSACAQICEGGKVIVKQLVYVTKEDLTLLKKGEETKTKTYEALCIKLSHAAGDDQTATPTVTDSDISNINSYRNTDSPHERIVVQQKTPIRVLHRRPLLTRTRKILQLEAKRIPDHPQLFWVRVVTEAGTYVKEWVHGELGRTAPSLCTALGARADILALDVAAVDLPWPNDTTHK